MMSYCDWPEPAVLTSQATAMKHPPHHWDPHAHHLAPPSSCHRDPTPPWHIMHRTLQNEGGEEVHTKWHTYIGRPSTVSLSLSLSVDCHIIAWQYPCMQHTQVTNRCHWNPQHVSYNFYYESVCNTLTHSVLFWCVILVMSSSPVLYEVCFLSVHCLENWNNVNKFRSVFIKVLLFLWALHPDLGNLLSLL